METRTNLHGLLKGHVPKASQGARPLSSSKGSYGGLTCSFTKQRAPETQGNQDGLTASVSNRITPSSTALRLLRECHWGP